MTKNNRTNTPSITDTRNAGASTTSPIPANRVPGDYAVRAALDSLQLAVQAILRRLPLGAVIQKS